MNRNQRQRHDEEVDHPREEQPVRDLLAVDHPRPVQVAVPRSAAGRRPAALMRLFNSASTICRRRRPNDDAHRQIDHVALRATLELLEQRQALRVGASDATFLSGSMRCVPFR